jgi:hypothetical protein
MKILVMIPFDWDNLKEIPSFIIEQTHGEDISIFSPSIYAEAFLYQGAHDFMARIVSIALTVAQDTEELIPWNNRATKVYVGACPRNVEFDMILAYKKDTLSTQEEYLKTVLHDGNYSDLFSHRMYASSDATKFFEDKESLAAYLLEVAKLNAS